MKRYFLTVVLCAALLMAVPVSAHANIKYYPDPVYQKFGPDDTSPMADMVDMASQGDVRAQFIMGDLYSKGKGGVAKDPAEARHWFEESGRHGYAYSFLRLAAMAKRENKPLEAWQWYSLAIKAFDDGDERKFAITARHDVAESAKLSLEDLRQARKSMSDWEDDSNKRLSDEKKALEGKNKETQTVGVTADEQN